MTAVASQPRTRSRRVTVKRPITAFAASSIITTMIGTAITPLTTALQNSALIGSIGVKSIADAEQRREREDARRSRAPRASVQAQARSASANASATA